MFTFQNDQYKRAMTQINNTKDSPDSNQEISILKRIDLSKIKNLNNTGFDFGKNDSEIGSDPFISNFENSEFVSFKNSSTNQTPIIKSNITQTKTDSVKKSPFIYTDSDTDISVWKCTSGPVFNYYPKSKENNDIEFVPSNPFLAASNNHKILSDEKTSKELNMTSHDSLKPQVNVSDQSNSISPNNNNKVISVHVTPKLKPIQSKLLDVLESKISEENSNDYDSEEKITSADRLSFKNQINKNFQVHDFLFESIKQSNLNQSNTDSMKNTKSRKNLNLSLKIDTDKAMLAKKNSIQSTKFQHNDYDQDHYDLHKSTLLNIANFQSVNKKKHSSMIDNSSSNLDYKNFDSNKKSNLAQKILKQMRENKLSKKNI